MLKTKKDIDKHVADILSKLKSEQERHHRGFNFAKYYYNIKEYESAKRYLSGFLSCKETSPAHKLMGQIYEQFGQFEKAVQSYKRSLELDGHQKDVVLKLCELYCHIPVDPERARYWADRAEQLFPHHEVVFRLRESLVSVDGDQNTQELEDLITNELIIRPRDVKLRIKLLKLYLDTERITEAYNHAVQVEKKSPYPDSIEWYYCLADVFEAYLEDQNHRYDQSLSIQILNAFDKLVYLNIVNNNETDKENCNSSYQSRSTASSSALYSFDLHLYHASKIHPTKSDVWSAFLEHMKGQLYFHMAVIMLKRIKMEHGSQKEASRFGASLLLAAYSFKAPNTANKSIDDDDQKSFHQMLYGRACYRLSQSGHIIMGMCREDKSKWIGRVREQVCTAQIKEKIYQRVFNNKSQKTDTLMSYFIQSNLLSEMSEEFPDSKSLLEYDMVSVTLYPEDLHHLVWIFVQQYNPKAKSQPMYGVHIFRGLPYNAKLEISSPESLCLLDVEAFLFATVRCSAMSNDDLPSFAYASSDTPMYLPACICKQMCTKEQSNWWRSAYSLYSNSCSPDKVGEARRRLQHGIEVLRAVGNHGMDVNLVVYLARIFAEKAVELKGQTVDAVSHVHEVKHLEARAELYWKAAIDLLEKLSKNITIRCPKECLFANYGRQPSLEEVNNLLEDGRFFLACHDMNYGRLEEAITGFDVLSSPYASFYQAMAYKKLAAEEFGSKAREAITSEMRSRHVILLTQARGGLYRTLDRIGSDHKHPLNKLLSDEIEYIETRLARIDPDTAQRQDLIASDVSCSQESEEQDPDLPSQTYPINIFADLKGFQESTPRPGLLTNLSSFLQPKNQGTPVKRQSEHVRPSPERLDAQIKSLANWHETVIQTLVEQNKSLMDANRAIVEELKGNKTVIEKLTVQLVELNKKLPGISKLPLPQKTKQRNQKPSDPVATPNRHLNFEENEEDCEENYYDGYYYHEDDSDGDGSNPEKLDMHDNPYGQPDQQMNNDYRYGQNSGVHGNFNFMYPVPQVGYGYYPSAQGLAGQVHIGANSANNLHGSSSQPMTAMNSNHFYGSGPTTMFTGLPFSEGQKLPEFHFNIESQLEDSNTSASSGKIVAPKTTTGADTFDNKFNFASIRPNESTVGVFNQTPRLLNNSGKDMTPPSAFMPTIGVPHAFQIQLTPTTTFQRDTATSEDVLGFNQAGAASLFTDSGTKLVDNKGNDLSRTESESYNDEDSLGPEFKPIIPLPAEVETKTGEEEEKVLFEDRAKLYRFSAKEWKERGLGVVKILHNEKTNKVRLLMRRDQIYKICANHNIMPEMTLIPMQNNTQMWIWAAQDFSDGQAVDEQFCIKFKAVEIGHRFKQKFEFAKELLKEKKDLSPNRVEAILDDKSNSTESFGERFRPKPGSWNCNECYVNNSLDSSHCVACGTLNPSSVIKIDASKGTPASQPLMATTPSSSFKFGISSQSTVNSMVSSSNEGFKFGIMSKPSVPATAPSSNEGFKFGIASQSSLQSTTPAFNEGFKFGIASHPSIQSTAPSSTTEGFKFGITNIASQSSIHSTEPSSNESFKYEVEDNESVSSTGFIFGKSPQSKTSGYVFGASNMKSNDFGDQPQDAEESDQNKYLFGGFSFKSNPIVAVSEKPNTVSSKPIATSQKVESSKPNPFSNFTFASTTVKSNEILNAQLNQETSKIDAAKWGSNSTHSNLTFGGIANDGVVSEAFKEDPNFKGFQGSGATLFPTSPGSANEEFESTAQFKPVISLPELVNVYTGEEDEEKLFGERAKLFRFNSQTKEWKERGIGELKIMKHKQTERVRVLMRRDQVFKICANHYIDVGMKLQKMATSDTAWVWVAQDFSEGELREEKLAAKFKNSELAKAFYDAFENARQTVSKIVESAPQVDVPSEPTTQSLSELFKPKPGSWTCESCCIINSKGNTKCIACETPRPCQGLNLADIFKPEEGSWKCDVCLVQNKKGDVSCAACQTSKPGTVSVNATVTSNSATPTWKFGQSTPKKDDELPKALDLSTGFQFGTRTPVFKFGSSPSKIDFQFGTSQAFNFCFDGVRPKSPAKTPKSPEEESANEGDGEDETTLDSEGDSIYFHPVISLPDKVELRTGEEDEDVLYCQQAKLFRWADGEWKERGVGDFKLLRHNMSTKIRLFMRRKPILKVCCNHYLTSKLVFKPKDERSWLWVAQDFADHELKTETFVLRFKTAELSQAFKSAVDEALRLINTEGSSTDALKAFSFKPKEPKVNLPSTAFTFGSTQQPCTPDVEVIEEKLAEHSLREKAKSFQLPANFYSYEQQEACPGCRGCYSSDEEESEDTKNLDIAVVYQKKPTEEQIKKATDLKLPPTFYLYENLPDCEGCRGCIDYIPETGPREEIVTTIKDNEIPRQNEQIIIPATNEPVFGERIPFTMNASNGFSFADLSRQEATFVKSGAVDPNFKFEGSGAKLFTYPKGDEDGDDNDDNADHDPQFKPVIPLPNLITVVTGEEDEDKLFGSRCKLYRYDPALKQWKERGTGEMKILKNRLTGKYRLLMRREQIHKTVCNQRIRADVDMQPFPTSESAWCWAANDFSGEKVEHQNFAVRFKTQSIAEEFYKIYKEGQESSRFHTEG